MHVKKAHGFLQERELNFLTLSLRLSAETGFIDVNIVTY